jgi:hypothetical protein
MGFAGVETPAYRMHPFKATEGESRRGDEKQPQVHSTPLRCAQDRSGWQPFFVAQDDKLFVYCSG